MEEKKRYRKYKYPVLPMSKETKILIVDDHRVVKEGIESLMISYPEFEVIGGALDGQEALEKIKELKPDIVIMDIEMPKMNGIDVTREIRKI